MALLYSYLHKYRMLILLALVLATTNQVFSLLDPLIFRHVIDDGAAAANAKIDVDIRHRHTFGVKETFEEKVVLKRIYVRDPKAIGDK